MAEGRVVATAARLAVLVVALEVSVAEDRAAAMAARSEVWVVAVR